MNTLSSCLLIFVLIVSSNAAFTMEPVDVFTPLGTNSIFTCEIDDYDDIDEYVLIASFPGEDGIMLDEFTSEVDLEPLRDRGVYFTISANSIQMTLMVLATIENNGTSIECRELVFPDYTDSQLATLTVTGPPLPPGLNTDTQNDSISITWDEPFTWPGHNVVIYIITERDINGDRTQSQPSNSLNSGYSHIYTMSTEVRDSCEAVLVEVLAISDLGWSQPAESRIKIPRFPGAIGNVRAVAVSGSSQLNIRVEPPALCEFQSGNITVKISRESSNETLVTKSLLYSGQPVELFFQVDVLDLNLTDNNGNYGLAVSAETMGVVVTKGAIVPGALLDSLGTTTMMTDEATSSTQSTLEVPSTSTQCALSDVVLVAALAAAAGVLLLALLLALAILARIYLCRPTKSKAHMAVAGDDPIELDRKEVM